MCMDFSKEEFDIIIQAGQSNSQGWGCGPVSNPFVSNDNIWFLNNDFSISKACKLVFGTELIGDFSLSFCSEYIEKGRLLPGRKLLVIRAAVGATGFLDNHWKLTDDLFLRMIEMTKKAIDLNPKNKLIALLWHQGETETAYKASKSTHYNNLSTLVTATRNTFLCKSLPFIAGDFVQQWKMENIEVCEPVVSAIKEVCNNIGNAIFIETDELQSNDQRIGNGDTIHFCGESIDQLGIKYFEALCKLSD